MSTLLDTNVLSELLRAVPDPAVLRWFGQQPADSLSVCSVTQAEMLLGARLLPAGKRRQQLQAALSAMFETDFAGRLLPFDATAAVVYADLVSVRRAAGRPISQFDAQIAAIARCRGTALATRDTAGFEGCALRLVNPWDAS